MKNPTAILLWKRLIIMVPPTLSNTIIREDQTLEKPSPGDRFDITHIDMIVIKRDRANIEYLKIVREEKEKMNSSICF